MPHSPLFMNICQVKKTSALGGLQAISYRSTSRVLPDLKAKRLLFMTPWRKHDTVLDFKAEVVARGGRPDQVKHACMDIVRRTRRASPKL